MPSPPTDLQPLILARAGELFRHYGFAATTVKQIAQASGCTNAALYYYFPQGKTQIMHEVVQHSLQDINKVSDAVGSAPDLGQFFTQLSQIVGGTMPGVARELGWLLVEFSRLPTVDQQFVQGQILTLQRAIAAGLARFTATQEEAARMAWLIICAFFGYELLFLTMGITTADAPSLQEFGQIVGNALAGAP